MTTPSQILVAGEARGPVLRFGAPISFWGGIDPTTAKVTLSGHPQEGQLVKDRILVLPRLVGSSGSSAILLELCYAGIAPAALILGERDAILPVGALVAKQMGWPSIPVLLVQDPAFATGSHLEIDRDGRISAV